MADAAAIAFGRPLRAVEDGQRFLRKLPQRPLSYQVSVVIWIVLFLSFLSLMGRGVGFFWAQWNEETALTYRALKVDEGCAAAKEALRYDADVDSVCALANTTLATWPIQRAIIHTLGACPSPLTVILWLWETLMGRAYMAILLAGLGLLLWQLLGRPTRLLAEDVIAQWQLHRLEDALAKRQL